MAKPVTSKSLGPSKMTSFLRSFPALVFGTICLLVALLLSSDTNASMILFSWMLGLVAASLHFGRKPGGIVWILSIGSAVLLLASLGQQAGPVLAIVAIWCWALTQLIFSNSMNLTGRGLWVWHLLTVFLIILGCASFQLPQEISKPDVQFGILCLATVLPLALCRLVTADAEVFWRNLNFQSLLIRGLWVGFALKWASQPAVLDFPMALAGLSVLAVGMVFWRASRASASVGQNIALTLLAAQICLGAPGSTIEPALLLLVPLSLAPILGVQSGASNSHFNRVWAKLDAHGLGSPLALALLCLAAYLQTESFFTVGVSCAAVMLIGAQIWRESGIEDQLLLAGAEGEFGRVLGRAVLYAGGFVVLITEFVGLL